MYNVFFVDVNGVRIDQFPRTNDDVVILRPRVQNKEGNPSGSVTIYLRINSVISARLVATFETEQSVAIPIVHTVPEPGLVTIHPTSLDVDVTFKIRTEVDWISSVPVTGNKVDLGIPYISTSSQVSEYTKIVTGANREPKLTDFRRLSVQAVRPSRRDAVVHMDQILDNIRDSFTNKNPNIIYNGYVDELITRSALANLIGGGTLVSPGAGDLQGWYDFEKDSYKIYMAAMPLFTYANTGIVGRSIRNGQVSGIDALVPIVMGTSDSVEYGETSPYLQPMVINGKVFIARAPYYGDKVENYSDISTYKRKGKDYAVEGKTASGDVVDYLYSLSLESARVGEYAPDHTSFHNDLSLRQLYIGGERPSDHIYADQLFQSDVLFQHPFLKQAYGFKDASSVTGSSPRYRPILEEIRNDGRGIRIIPGNMGGDPNTPEYWHTHIPGSYAELRDQMGITYNNGEVVPTHPWVDRWLEVIYDTRQYFIPATAIVENLPGSGAIGIIGTGTINTSRIWSSNTLDGKYPFSIGNRRYHTSIEIMRSGFFKSFSTGVDGAKLLNVSMWDRLMGALGGVVDSWHPGFDHNPQYELPSIKVIERVPGEITKGRLRASLAEGYYEPVARAESTPNSQRALDSTSGSTDRFSLRPILRTLVPIVKMPVKTNAVRALTMQEILTIHSTLGTHGLVTLVSDMSPNINNLAPEEINKVWKFDDGDIVFNHRTANLDYRQYAALGLFTDIPVDQDKFIAREYKPMPRPHIYLDGEMYRLRLSKLIHESILNNGVMKDSVETGLNLGTYFSEEQQIRLWLNKAPEESQVITTRTVEIGWPIRHDSKITRNLNSAHLKIRPVLGDTFVSTESSSDHRHTSLTLTNVEIGGDLGVAKSGDGNTYQATLVGERLPNDGNGLSGGSKIKIAGAYAQISNSIHDPVTHSAPFDAGLIDQSDEFIQIFKDGKELLLPSDEPIYIQDKFITLLLGLINPPSDTSTPIPVLRRNLYIGEKWYLLRLMTVEEVRAYFPPLIRGTVNDGDWTGQKIANYPPSTLLKGSSAGGYQYLVSPGLTQVMYGEPLQTTMNNDYQLSESNVNIWSGGVNYHGLFILEHMPNFVDNRDIVTNYIVDSSIPATISDYLSGLSIGVNWSYYSTVATKVISDTGELTIQNGRTRASIEALYTGGVLYRPWENVICPISNWYPERNLNYKYTPAPQVDSGGNYLYMPSLRDPVDIRRLYNARGNESTEFANASAIPTNITTRYKYPREMMASEMFLKVLSKSSHGNLGDTYNPDIEYYPPIEVPGGPGIKPATGAGFYDIHLKIGARKYGHSTCVGYISPRDNVPLISNVADEVISLIMGKFPKDQIRLPEASELLLAGGPFGTGASTMTKRRLLKLMGLEPFGDMDDIDQAIEFIQLERSHSMYLFPIKPICTNISYMDLYVRGLVTGSPHAYVDHHLSPQITQLRDFTLTVRDVTYRLVPRIPRTFPTGVRYASELDPNLSLTESLVLSDYNRILMPVSASGVLNSVPGQVVSMPIGDVTTTLSQNYVLCQEHETVSNGKIARRRLNSGLMHETITYISRDERATNHAWLPIFEVYRVR